MNLLPDSPINTPYVEIHSHDTPPRDSESSRLLNVQMTYGFKSDAGYRPAAYQTFDSASTQINSTTDGIKIHNHNHNHNYSPSSITTESNQPSPAYSPICSKTYDLLPSETSDNDKYYNYSDNNPVEINSSTNYELPINTDDEKNLNNHSSSCESNNYDYNEIYSPEILNDDEKKLLSLDSIEIKSIINSNSSDNSIATSIKSDDDIDNELSGCDIEQCLMQIEESLLNIEQNLLHVQNLEIPQLNNLLNNRFIMNNHNSNNDNKKKLNGLKYKRPCSENSKYNYNNYYLDNKLLMSNYIRLSHSDSDIDIEKNIYFNSPKRDCLDNNDSTYSKYSSLLKKSQTLIEDNFKKIQLLNEIKSDFINFNSCNNDNNLGKSVKLINDKNLFNSFDNNYDYDDDYSDTNKKRINSLSNYFLKSSVSSSSSINCRKTSSQGAIEKYRRDNEFKVRKKKLKVCRSINISSDGLFDDINCKKSDKLRKKFKTIATTKDIMMSFKKLKVSDNGSKSRNFVIKDIDDNSREESKGDDDKKKLIDNNKCSNKSKSLQSHDNNALVPSKLLSLSFSLLLAALLQAVRCLADIVEDTFRSVTFDKYALHE